MDYVRGRDREGRTVTDLERCDAEIAALEADILGGCLDFEGALQGLGDWEAERRMIEKENARNETD